MFFVKKDKKRNKLTTLASLSLAFVFGGIIFGDNRIIGYILMGIGVLLAIIDTIRKLKKSK